MATSPENVNNLCFPIDFQGNLLSNCFLSNCKHGGATSGYRTLLNARISASEVRSLEDAGANPVLSSEAPLAGVGATEHVQALQSYGMELEMEMKQRSLCGCAENSDTATRNVQRLKRKKVLEQKKMSDEVIKAAYSHNDHLSPFPSFRHFNRNGVSLYLESGRGDKLSFLVKKYIQNLLKMNMEASYGYQWSAEEKIKHREMVSTQARYIFVYDNDEADPSASNADNAIPIPMVAFLHFRFLVEETIPVLYVYELQIEPRVQGRGLGQFLMELIQLIAIKNCMGAVVFTVQKANSKAFNFYQTKLGYTISTISPSRVNSSMTIETSCEILCKAFNEEARVVLEGEPSTLNH